MKMELNSKNIMMAFNTVANPVQHNKLKVKKIDVKIRK